MPAILQKIIAGWRNRVEATFGEVTDLMELARHGAHSFWGLLTRTAAIIAAHTLVRACLHTVESTHITRLRGRISVVLTGIRPLRAEAGGARRRAGGAG
jgi:hypothetical protein